MNYRTSPGPAESGPGEQERHIVLGPRATRPVPPQQPQLRDPRVEA